MPQIFELPDVGEGLTEAEILAWRVTPGETVTVNQVLVEIETAKSVVELPSPYAGTVLDLLVPEGRTVEVGTPIIAVGSRDETPAAPTAAPGAAAEEGRPLVGAGPKADPPRRRRRAAPAPAPGLEPAPVSEPASEQAEGSAPDPAGGSAAALGVPRRRTLAKPPVRKAARDLGIDLADVPATGAAGQITKQDLLAHAGRLRDAGIQRPAPLDDARIERVPVKGVRKATAENMVRSAFSAPHASVFVDVDATRTMEFVRRLKAAPDYQGVKVTPLLVLARAVMWAVARTPHVNATWTDEEILVKHFVNLGIAAATPRGLMVPNIKDAQDLSLRELAVALEKLSRTAREGRTPPADMRNGTVTITNIGPLGLDTGTPILNPGEAAIVAFGSIKQKPWVVDGAVVPRWVTTLGASFDHRVVDGDLAARFTADVARILEEPALLLN